MPVYYIKYNAQAVNDAGTTNAQGVNLLILYRWGHSEQSAPFIDLCCRHFLMFPLLYAIVCNYVNCYIKSVNSVSSYIAKSWYLCRWILRVTVKFNTILIKHLWRVGSTYRFWWEFKVPVSFYLKMTFWNRDISDASHEFFVRECLFFLWTRNDSNKYNDARKSRFPKDSSTKTGKKEGVNSTDSSIVGR